MRRLPLFSPPPPDLQSSLRRGRLSAGLTLVLLSLALDPAAAATRKYVATYDVPLFTEGTVVTVAQPILEIQNPKDNSGSITVTSVKIPWNPLDSRTAPSTGVWKHADAKACTVVSSTTLAAGEGLTINGLSALDQCPDRVTCNTQTCSITQGCPDSGCHCILFWPPGNGRCINLDTEEPVPSRLTFEVVFDDQNRDLGPSVRAHVAVTNADGALVGFHGAEVDREDAQ